LSGFVYYETIKRELHKRLMSVGVMKDEKHSVYYKSIK
jgi:hypothetical protein